MLSYYQVKRHWYVHKKPESQDIRGRG